MAFSFVMARVNFTKVAESNSDLLARVVVRGTTIGDLPEAYRSLTRVGYYRLTGYMLPFQTGHQPDPHRFKAGTSFEQVRWSYELDRKLRWLVLDAIEPIEVAVRSALCNRLAKSHGPHWHTNPALFDTQQWEILSRKIAETLEFDLQSQCRVSWAKKGSNLFLDHYYSRYSLPAMPPCWMLMEVASFGLVARIFKTLAAPSDRKNVAQEFPFPDRKPIDESVLGSWLHGLSVLRNRCAHHSRLIHRHHPFPPIRTSNVSVGHLFTGGAMLREFLVVLAVLTKSVEPKSDWLRRLYFLLEASSGVDLPASIGLHPHWRQDRLWELAW